MAQFGSQLKLLPSSAKRSTPSIDWNQASLDLCGSRILNDIIALNIYVLIVCFTEVLK